MVKCRLTVKAYGLAREQFGGNSNYDRGDAYKSACSDALGKCASQLGIGSYVYKGLVRPPAPPATNRTSGTNPAAARAPRQPERAKSIPAKHGAADPKSRNHLYWFEEMKRVLGVYLCEEVFRKRAIGDASEIRDLAEARDLFRQLVTILDRQYLALRSNLRDGEYEAILETLKYPPDPPNLSLTQRLKIYELMKKAASPCGQ